MTATRRRRRSSGSGRRSMRPRRSRVSSTVVTVAVVTMRRRAISVGLSGSPAPSSTASACRPAADSRYDPRARLASATKASLVRMIPTTASLAEIRSPAVSCTPTAAPHPDRRGYSIPNYQIPSDFGQGRIPLPVVGRTLDQPVRRGRRCPQHPITQGEAIGTPQAETRRPPRSSRSRSGRSRRARPPHGGRRRQVGFVLQVSPPRQGPRRPRGQRRPLRRHGDLSREW